jgi:hypothetical protein
MKFRHVIELSYRAQEKEIGSEIGARVGERSEVLRLLAKEGTSETSRKKLSSHVK